MLVFSFNSLLKNDCKVSRILRIICDSWLWESDIYLINILNVCVLSCAICKNPYKTTPLINPLATPALFRSVLISIRISPLLTRKLLSVTFWNNLEAWYEFGFSYVFNFSFATFLILLGNKRISLHLLWIKSKIFDSLGIRTRSFMVTVR